MNIATIVLITVLSTLLAIYLIGFICSLIFSYIFKKKINNKLSQLNLLLVEKKDTISNIDKSLKTLNIVYDDELNDLINKVNSILNIKINIDDHKDIVSLLDNASNKLISFINKKKINNQNEFISSIKEINDSYRQNVSIINYDIVGYNYWINLRPYRFYYSIRKKDILDKFE